LTVDHKGRSRKAGQGPVEKSRRLHGKQREKLKVRKQGRGGSKITWGKKHRGTPHYNPWEKLTKGGADTPRLRNNNLGEGFGRMRRGAFLTMFRLLDQGLQEKILGGGKITQPKYNHPRSEAAMIRNHHHGAAPRRLMRNIPTWRTARNGKENLLGCPKNCWILRRKSALGVIPYVRRNERDAHSLRLGVRN